jgi:hypothetical protein
MTPAKMFHKSRYALALPRPGRRKATERVRRSPPYLPAPPEQKLTTDHLPCDRAPAGGLPADR